MLRRGTSSTTICPLVRRNFLVYGVFGRVFAFRGVNRMYLCDSPDFAQLFSSAFFFVRFFLCVLRCGKFYGFWLLVVRCLTSDSSNIYLRVGDCGPPTVAFSLLFLRIDVLEIVQQRGSNFSFRVTVRTVVCFEGV